MALPYRLLALDLDGTLIDGRLEFSPAVRAAIAAAQAAGVHVTLATGRTVRATRPFASALGIELPLICYQGAHVEAADGTVLYHQPVPGALAAELVRDIQALGFHIQAYLDDALWVGAERAEIEWYTRYSPVPLPVHVVADLPALVAGRAPTKLVWVAPEATIGATLPELAARYAGRLAVFRSHDLFAEAADPGCSKGTALAALAERLAIPRAQVAAIGDRENDAPMLAWAGLGVAMGNADEAARAAADLIAPPFSEDGAAWAIRRYLLGEAGHDA